VGSRANLQQKEQNGSIRIKNGLARSDFIFSQVMPLHAVLLRYPTLVANYKPMGGYFLVKMNLASSRWYLRK
jgi:hypothetical protein